MIKSLGYATTHHEIDRLVHLVQQGIEQLLKQHRLFRSETDEMIVSVLSSLSNSNIQTVSPEIIFGKIFDNVGFNEVKEDLFRYLVIYCTSHP